MPFVTPVQHNIPSGYDYKNVNIRNFKGINCSENVFDNKISGCQDCENLYVNENDILAVRPRLQHEAKFENAEVIKAQSISSNEMIYVVSTNDGTNLIISDKNTAGEQTGDTVITDVPDLGECSFFKTGDDKILCTSENGLFIIENDTIREVTLDDGYVPTTRINMEFGDETSGDVTNEPSNLLSNKEHRHYPISWLNQTISKDNLPDEIDISNMVTKKDVDVVDQTFSYDFENWPNFSVEKSMSIKIDNDILPYILLDDGIGYTHKLGPSLSNTIGETLYDLPDDVELGKVINDTDSTKIVFPKPTEANFIRVGNNSDFKALLPVKVQFSKTGLDEYISIKFLSNINRGDIVYSSKVSNNIFDNITEGDDVSVGCYVVQNKLVTIITTNSNIVIISEVLLHQLASYDPPIDQNTATIFSIENNDIYTIESMITGFRESTILILMSNKNDGFNSNRAWKFKLYEYDDQTSVFEDFSVVYEDDYYNKTLNLNVNYTLYKISELSIKILRNNNNDTYFLRDHEKYNDLDTYYSINPLGVVDKFTDDFWQNLYVKHLDNTSWTIFSKFKDDNTVEQYLSTNYSEDAALIKLGEITIPTKTDDTYIDVEYDTKTKLITTIVTANSESYQATSWGWQLKTDGPYLVEILETQNDYEHSFSKVKQFDNKYFFYGDKNLVRWTYNTKLLYIPKDNFDNVGKSEDITNMIQLNTQQLGVFKKDETNILVRDDSGIYLVYTLKTPKGCQGPDQATIIPTTNIPVVITEDAVCVVQQGSNNVLEDAVFTIISDDIFEKFSVIKDKYKIKTHVHGHYIYFYLVEDSKTKIWVLDCRSNDWFKWELPVETIMMYESDTTLSNASETETRIVTKTDEYVLTNIMNTLSDNDDTEFSEYLVSYQDNLGDGTYRRIPWFWKSRVLTLGTNNYLKKITNLQLTFSDNSKRFKYGKYSKVLVEGQFVKNNAMFYEIKTYRKKSKFLNGSFVGELDGVGTQRIKLRLPKCDFAELTISNYRDSSDSLGVQSLDMFVNGQSMNILKYDDSDPFISTDYENSNNVIDRLHLIGITFKVLLSEGIS